MIFGIVCGFTAALLNSLGYLFSARFLLYHKNPLRLLVMATLVMQLISLPLLVIFPFGEIENPLKFFGQMLLSCMFFLIGQGGFFAALRLFEASRLSSLLGLKIIVLSVGFVLSGGTLNIWQMAAVLMAAAAALIFNRSGSGRSSWKGWLLLLMTLCCYSSVDILETDLVLQVHETVGYSKLHSSLVVVPPMYVMLGILTMPVLFFLKPDKGQLKLAAPYAVLWLLSQVVLFCCFALLKPVFGNVILATRGIFSVLSGALLPFFGLAALDSQIPVSLWIRRGVAALLMLGAIAVYSLASM
ncbi:MAG: hypothetical protein J6S43_03780 [Lentisphaeria bacterium]|nr:hypothetical protein [Lentisphaeria bacterium]